jgi:hypothetical protein
MYNYEHEMKEIKDRFLKNFIFYDYFHDSLITKLSILDEGKLVQLELSCEREWPSHDWTQFADDMNYIYILSFMNCTYIEYDRSDIGTFAEYLNGRFKDSAKLREINLHSKKKNYHLRIQLADGYIDLIFNKFLVEKLTGNIELPKRIPLEWHFDWVKSKFIGKSIDDIRHIASTGEFPLRSFALEYLWVLNDEYTYDLAINALSDEDASIPAVFIIGEIGTFQDIGNISRISNEKNVRSIEKRHIKDAIEKILEKR